MQNIKHQQVPADNESTPAPSDLAQPVNQEKLNALQQLAKVQGHLTYDDLNDGLLNDLVDPADIEKVMRYLRGLGVHIHDDAAGGKDDTEPAPVATVDCSPDPERLYFRQLGKAPLLTREQEVGIFKRIENAEASVARQFHAFGIAAEAYLDLAEKLRDKRERVDRIVLDHQNLSRERYLKDLAALCGKVKALHDETTVLFRKLSGKNPRGRKKMEAEFQANVVALGKLYARFRFKPDVIE